MIVRIQYAQPVTMAMWILATQSTILHFIHAYTNLVVSSEMERLMNSCASLSHSISAIAVAATLHMRGRCALPGDEQGSSLHVKLQLGLVFLFDVVLVVAAAGAIDVSTSSFVYGRRSSFRVPRNGDGVSPRRTMYRSIHITWFS